jgi:hypothetical protein
MEATFYKLISRGHSVHEAYIETVLDGVASRKKNCNVSENQLCGNVCGFFLGQTSRALFIKTFSQR